MCVDFVAGYVSKAECQQKNAAYQGMGKEEKVHHTGK